MKNFKRIRDSRARNLAEGSAQPVAFWFDDPELTTVDGAVFEIHFNDMIDDWYGISSAMVTEALLSANGKDVLVHVNSPGGMVFEGLSIHSAFKQYAGKVTMRVEGLAASAASYVIMAGDEILIEPGAMIMIHDASDFTIGNAAEHRKTADVLDKVSDSIAAIYADRSGTEAATWRAAMLEETWYGGQEAVDAGLADSVVASAATEPGDTGARRATAKWAGLFDHMPRAEVADEPGPDPVPPTDAPPLPVNEPPVDPEPAADPDPAPEPDPEVEPEKDNPTDLEDLLAGIDLKAAIRDAFRPKGVPA